MLCDQLHNILVKLIRKDLYLLEYSAKLIKRAKNKNTTWHVTQFYFQILLK